jgi:D-alanine--poly(phosphoribitol) ligase subunit 2
MPADSRTLERVRLLIREVLSVDLPSDNTDLIDAEYIDSLGLVTMIAAIEQEFRMELPLDDFDIEQFRSIDRIGELVAKAAPAVT